VKASRILIAVLPLALCACSSSEESCDPCNSPPDDYCSDANTLLVHPATGDCRKGECQYPPTEQNCPDGCFNGACNTDPCANMTCDQPPGPCYLATGTCVADPDAHCEYAQLPDGAACDDGSACTVNDTCQSGVCTPGEDQCGLEIVVLIYNAADNDLDESMAIDFQTLQDANVDNYDFVRLFVLWDRVGTAAWTDTRFYEIHNGDATELDAPNLGLTVAGAEELNMGDPAVLNNFILDVRALVGTAPDYYLIMADHGDGWWRHVKRPGMRPPVLGCCYDETSGDDYLEEIEITQAISGMGIKVLGFDACLQGMAEVAYQHRNDAGIMIASQETEYDWGWDWVEVFARFGQSADHSALNFAHTVVDTYIALSKDNQDEFCTLAVYDLTAMDALAASATAMAPSLIALSTNDYDQICANLEFYSCDGTDCEEYVDFVQLANLAAGVDPANTSIYNAAAEAVAQAVIYEDHGSSHPNAHGMNVYYPCYYWPYDEYQGVNWAQDTGWDDLVLAH
jgi:hypothetical protein